MADPLGDLLAGAEDLARALTGRDRVRLAVTGLSRAGKTVFLTSLVSNLLAAGQRGRALPALEQACGGRLTGARLVPAIAQSTPRFDPASHLEALAADPPRWPARTDDLAGLEIELEVTPGSWLATARGMFTGPRRVTLELLDYPGEWLLDLPMFGQAYAAWSTETLARLRRGKRAQEAAAFLAFVDALPPGAPADEALARRGFALYRDMLRGCRDRRGLRFLQPGRALQPGPRGEAPLLWFFPLPHPTGPGLADLMARRHAAYLADQRATFFDPFFRRFHRQAVLVDVLGALHAGEEGFDDTAEALSAIAGALRRDGGPLDWLTGQGLRRVAFTATKADHVPGRSRRALTSLMRDLVGEVPDGALHAIAAVRCTQDAVMTWNGIKVPAVRGVLAEGGRMATVDPGDVPNRRPTAGFWSDGYFEMPAFQPPRAWTPGSGIPHLGLDVLLAWLIGDLL